MGYEVEDEIDWSDSPLNPPSPVLIAPVSTSIPAYRSPAVNERLGHEKFLFDLEVQKDNQIFGSYPNPKPASSSTGHSPTAEEDSHEYDSLFESDTPEEFKVPLGIPLKPAPQTNSNDLPNPSRAQRAALGVRLNRRIPSKEDYAHFALYQANQKAYEATFLKNFVAYALHKDQTSKFSSGVEPHKEMQKYLEIVSANVNHIANKMVWNAHCRAVNLLANDGKDGAPFFDVHTFNSDVFSDFGANDPAATARKMNEAWHRSVPVPTMVRYSTREYPVGCHNGPLEEIDEIAQTLFHKNAFSKTLPPGRPVKAPGKKRGRGHDLPGAVVREEQPSLQRGNWLAFPLTKPVVGQHSPPRVLHSYQETVYNVGLSQPDVVDQQVDDEELLFEPDSDNESQLIRDLMLELDDEPELIQDLRSEQRIYEAEPAAYSQDARTQDTHVAEQSPLESLYTSSCALANNSTQLEVLFDRYGPKALQSDHADSSSGSELNTLVEKVPKLRKWLVNDHKRRLTARWGNPPAQALRKYLPSIQQVIAQAIVKGFRPIAEDYQQRAKIIAAREREKSTRVCQIDREDPTVLEIRPSVEFPSHHAESSRQNMIELRQDLVDVIGESSKRTARAQKNSTPALPSSVETSLLLSPLSCSRTSNSVAGNDRKTRTSQLKKRKQKASMEPPRKKKKGTAPEVQNNIPETPSRPHPSGSQTLELHQILPPHAYFEPTSIDEEHAWRCGSNHAMGHYYNAGRRKNCRGCNVSLSDNPKHIVMDFYLPSRSFFFQSVPGMKWKPCKPLGKARKSSRPCHNSIAKDAYWEAKAANWTEDEALQHGIAAVTEFLKPKPPKEPTFEPTPEPEPDLGPHPSGSTTMEHGQDLPECAYADPQDAEEELAWRCDVNHALGRYYLAGDKKSCPGCGTNKNGKGKQITLDFYMPSGVVVRQEAPDLVKWKPRKYKMRKAGNNNAVSSAKKGKAIQNYTHNQICTELYLKAVAAGVEEQEALKGAIETADRYLDERDRESDDEDERHEDQNEVLNEDGDQAESSTHTRHLTISSSPESSPIHTPPPASTPTMYRRNPHGGCTVSLLPSKPDASDIDIDVEADDYTAYETEMEREVVVISSDEEEEESSGSDSE